MRVARDLVDPKWKKIRVRRASSGRSGVVIRQGGKRVQAASGSASLVLYDDGEERVAKRGGNAVQSRPSAGAKAGYSSKYRGVSWKKQGKTWQVRIRVDGKDKHIGYFANEIAAARAYDASAIANKLNKPLNFSGDAAAKGHVASSRFRGVGWHKRDQKWRVMIRVNGKQKSIGHFDDELVAAHAYDAYAITNGINTPRNFPNEDEDAVVAETARVRAAPKKRKNAASKSSRFRGVFWNRRSKKWQVGIYTNGKQKFLGSFIDEEKAGCAFDTYVVDNNLDRPLNFPVAAEADDESSSEDEKVESSGESDAADEDHGAAAAAPAAKRWRTFTHSSHAVAQPVDDDMESSSRRSSDDSVLGSDAEIQLLLYLTANAARRRALPLHQPLRPSHL